MENINFETIRFPHLLPGEVTVWKSFLSLYAKDYDKFVYDVRVGEGSLPEEVPQDIYTENFRWLTRKRIDVVGWKGSVPTIFEIRGRMTLPLMGQIVGYKYLWMRQNPDSIPPMMAAVCTFCQPDDFDVFRAHDVRVVVVPEWNADTLKTGGM
jgi:hypothetical protein